MIIVLKDRATHRVAKRIAPSLSLLKGPSLKIIKRTTFPQRIGKPFTPVLSLLAWIYYNRYQGVAETICTRHCKNMSRKLNCDIEHVICSYAVQINILKVSNNDEEAIDLGIVPF